MLEYKLVIEVKKLFILVFIGLLCFGCGKKNNVTINIYQNSEKDEKVIEEKKDKELNDNSSNIDVSSNSEETKEENLDSDNNNTTSSKDSKLDSIKEKAKDKYNTAKSWYDENKEELKEINKDIIQNDIDTVTNATDKVKSWYSDNKDSIKEKAKDKYNTGKEKLKDIFSNSDN